METPGGAKGPEYVVMMPILIVFAAACPAKGSPSAITATRPTQMLLLLIVAPPKIRQSGTRARWFLIAGEPRPIAPPRQFGWDGATSGAIAIQSAAPLS